MFTRIENISDLPMFIVIVKVYFFTKQASSYNIKDKN